MMQVIVYTKDEPELVKEMLIKCPEQLIPLFDDNDKPTGRYKLKASKIPTLRKGIESVSMLIVDNGAITETEDEDGNIIKGWLLNLDNADILGKATRQPKLDPHDDLNVRGRAKINRCRESSFEDEDGKTIELDPNRPIGYMA